MKVYIVKRFLSPTNDGIYIDKHKAEIKCNELNKRCIVKSMWYVQIHQVIE